MGSWNKGKDRERGCGACWLMLPSKLDSWDWHWLLPGSTAILGFSGRNGRCLQECCTEPACRCRELWLGNASAEAAHRQLSRNSRKHLKLMLSFCFLQSFKYGIEMEFHWIALVLWKMCYLTLLGMYLILLFLFIKDELQSKKEI